MAVIPPPLVLARLKFLEPPGADFSIDPEEVHLWTVDLDRGRPRTAGAALILSSPEKERAGRFHFPRHRERYMAGRMVLRKLLSRYTGTPPQELELAEDGRGKPCLKGNGRAKDLFFNQAESKGRMIVALARGQEVGVDLEWIDPRLEVRDVAKVALHPQEMKRLLEVNSEERRLRFFTLWTVKEAYLKGLGTGLRTAPNTIVVDPDQDPVSLTVLSGPPPQDWSVRLFSPWVDYCGAVAVQGGLSRITGLRFEDLPE